MVKSLSEDQRSCREPSYGANLETFRQGIVKAALDLFASHGVNLTVASTLDSARSRAAKLTRLPEVALLGVAGFGAPNFTGYVVINANEHVLRQSNRTASSLEDWMAELSNQLLGRIKNHLLRQGVAMQRMPPMVVTGLGASLTPDLKGAPLLFLKNEHGSVQIWLKSEPSTNGFQGEISDPPDGVMTEGEVVLF